MALELKLIEPLIVEGAECRRQATERPDQPELRGDDVNDETEPGLLRKLEAILGFTLHLDERISRRQKVRVQVVAAVRRKTEVANLVRSLERPMYQVSTNPDMFGPWHDVTSKSQIGPGLESLQPAFFDQFIPEATELKSGLVVAEVWASHHAKVYIGD